MKQEEWVFLGFSLLVSIGITILMVSEFSDMPVAIRLIALMSTGFCWFVTYVICKDIYK